MIVANGCNEGPSDAILLRDANINGYVFDYEVRSPTSIQVDAGNVRIRTGQTQIEVVDGTLRVDGRSFGAVKPKDHISVEKGKVSVNGDVRTKAN
jgi:hypothetical protein